MNLTSYWPRTNFAVSILVVVLLTLSIAPSAISKLSSIKMKTAEHAQSSKRDEASSKSGRKAVRYLRIKVENGTAIPGEASRIARQLRQEKLGDIRVGNAKYKTYANTTLKYRIQHVESALKVINNLSSEYFVTKTYKLSDKSPFDMLLLIGWDKKRLMKSYKVEVLNGNGRKGEASKIASLIRQRGFTNTNTANTNFVGKTQIRFNSTDKVIARIVNEIVQEEYFEPKMKSARYLSKKTITVILGL